MWKALTENMRDGLVVVDQTGSIQFTNRAACELLGRREDELKGHALGYPITNGENVTMNLLARSGQMLTVRLRSAEIEWHHAPAWLVVIHDVSELLAKQREVEQLNQKLAGQVADLEKFSYMVAHDLRAPIRTIKSFAGILEDDHRESVPAEALDVMHQIQERCDGMEELIESVLAFACSSIQPLKLEAIDLNDVVREIVRTLEEDSAAVTWTININIEPLPTVSGDPRLLRQVFTNLLSNALKYGLAAPQPEIRVYGSRHGNQHCISVADNGMGFTREDAERVFDAFTRLNPQKRNGTGVGLSIVRNIVTRHGGKVWAEGEKGKGATFHIELPASPGTPT